MHRAKVNSSGVIAAAVVVTVIVGIHAGIIVVILILVLILIGIGLRLIEPVCLLRPDVVHAGVACQTAARLIPSAPRASTAAESTKAAGIAKALE